MAKTLKAIHGEEIIVDDEDYEVLKAFHWQVSGKHRGVQKGGIVETMIGMGRFLLLNEFVKRKALDPSAEIDHINGNRLDNRKANLRVVSRSENAHYKWKNRALKRLRGGVMCTHKKCQSLATEVLRLRQKRYDYRCSRHALGRSHVERYSLEQ